MLDDDVRDRDFGWTSVGGNTGWSVPPRTGRDGALVVIAVVAGVLAVARDASVARVLWLAAVSAAMAAAIGWLAPLDRDPWSRRRRPRWLVSLSTLLGGAVLIAAAVELNSWWALIPVAGGAVGWLVHDWRSRRPGLRLPKRPAVIGLAVLLVLSPWIWSFVTAVVAPTSDPLSVRAVEWVREHGGASIVDDIEHWWYTRHPPPVGGKPAALLPHTAASSSPTTTSPPDPSLQRVPSPAGAPIGPEGQWQIVAGTAAHPAVATTLLRPDAIHTSLVVGLMRVDPRYVRLHLLAGSQQPGGPSPNGAMVPLGDRGSLIAAFNAGFRMNESNGGWFSDGRMVEPLRLGAASLVFYRDGHADVGVWGRDDSMGPEVMAVRQNLDLIVDGGHAVPGIDDSQNARWGKTVGQKVLVWRSGIGVTAGGQLIYVGGPGLSVQTLANVLISAGAVRAMELDINTAWVEAYTFQHSPTGPVGTKLLDAMHDPVTHYLAPETRDFVEVLAGPGISSGT